MAQLKAGKFAGLQVWINTHVGIDVMQIVNFHAELMLFWSLEWDLLLCRNKRKGEMLFKFTLDLHNTSSYSFVESTYTKILIFKVLF